MARTALRRGALEHLDDRFARQVGGRWRDLASGLPVDVSWSHGPIGESTPVSLSRERDDGWRRGEAAVVVAEGRHPDGRPFTVRRARQVGERGDAWCGTAAGADALRRLTEVLDAVEPARARAVHLSVPADAAIGFVERVAFEARERGLAVLNANVVASHWTVLREWRGRSVVVLATDGGPADEGTGGLAGGAVLVACSPARAAAIVRLSAAGAGAAPLAESPSLRDAPAVSPVAWAAGDCRTPVAQLLARRRFAACERALRRRAYLAHDRDAADAGIDAALALAGRLRQQGRSRDALSAVAHVTLALSSARTPDIAFEVAAATGCLRTDLGQYAAARDVLEGAWAASVAAHGRGHPGCGVMLARCCAWQGEIHRAVEVLDLVDMAPGTDDLVAAQWWALRVRVALTRGDIRSAHEAVRDAWHARPWGDPLARAWLLTARLRVHAALADVEGMVRAAREGTDAADRAHSLVAAATIRAALVGARLQRGPAREARAAARWLMRHRTRLPPLVRVQVDQALAEAGAAPRRQIGRARLTHDMGAPSSVAWRAGRRFEVVDEVVDVLQICQAADDERDALGRICALLRSRLGAVAVGFDAEDGTPLARASATNRVAFSLAERAVSTGSSIPPFEVDAGVETATAVRYGGLPIAALCARWCLDDRPDPSRVLAVLTTAAAAAAPAVRSVLDRRALPSAAQADDLDIVGGSGVIEDLRQRVRQAAQVPFPVLIEGESGSGKELVARALHRAGSRRHRRFCAINCAAITDDLLEAELFGHTRGAFTGAISERAGVFEEADGGTLFLDEVTELSPRAQAKLLRVLQEGEVRRVGENVARRVDVRIVAATNRSLSREVGLGRFRDDLRYRLDVVRLALPPLRERREDIALLAAHFWRDAAARAGSKATLDPDTLSALERYHWPGNVRELQNVMALLAVSAPRRGRVAAGMLPASLRTLGAPRAGGPARLDAARRSFEAGFVRDALLRNQGHRGSTARELGISRQGLSKLISRLGLPERGLSADSKEPTAEG